MNERLGLYEITIAETAHRAITAYSQPLVVYADAHFLLGYQYLTTGNAENASKQFKLAQAHLPDDKLLTQLVGMTTSPDASKSSETRTPPQPPAVPPEKVLKAEQLVRT
ncbi:MAG: hypothetical protein ACKV2Q_25490 [Planctomycetaceae bacterium]